MSEQTKEAGRDPAAVHEPPCEHCEQQVCGHQVCPKCHTRLMPVADETPPGDFVSELKELVRKQGVELDRLEELANKQAAEIAELRAQIAAMTTPAPSSPPAESEGGDDAKS